MALHDPVRMHSKTATNLTSYRVTVRTASTSHLFSAIAASSADAFEDAATKFADVPCGITVMTKAG